MNNPSVLHVSCMYLCRWCVCTPGAVRLCVCLQREGQRGPAAPACSSCADTTRHPACGAARWEQAVCRHTSHCRTVGRGCVFFSNFFQHCVSEAATASTDLTVEELTENGDTSLTLAAEAGLVDSVKTLLQNGASPHNTNSKNESPLLIGSTNAIPCMHQWLFQLPNTCIAVVTMLACWLLMLHFIFIHLLLNAMDLAVWGTFVK